MGYIGKPRTASEAGFPVPTSVLNFSQTCDVAKEWWPREPKDNFKPCYPPQLCVIRIYAISLQSIGICKLPWEWGKKASYCTPRTTGAQTNQKPVFEVSLPLPFYDELIFSIECNLYCYFILPRANKSHMASSNDLQRFEMGEFTPSRNHFIPAFTEPISHVWNRKLSPFSQIYSCCLPTGT